MGALLGCFPDVAEWKLLSVPFRSASASSSRSKTERRHEALEAEVEDLQGQLPPYVRRIGAVHEPRLLCGPDGQTWSPAEASDPTHWDLILTIRGSSSCPSYNWPFRVRLRFCRLWPEQPPEVCFLSAIKHWLVDEETRELQPAFYAALTQSTGPTAPRHTVRAVLSQLHAVLANPQSAIDACHAAPVLPCAKGASRYEGEFQHPAFGEGSRELSLWLQSQEPGEELQWEGRWETAGQSGRIVVSLDASLQVVTARGKTALGDVTLEGLVGATSGVLCGAVALGGGFEGSFELRPAAAAAAAAGAERENLRRLEVVRQYGVMARHPALFAEEPVWEPSWLGFSAPRGPEAWRLLLTEHVPGQVFSFPLFSGAFCDLLAQEVLNFYGSGLKARRPNSMNNYGIVLADIGLEAWVDGLQDLLRPLGELLWPEGPGVAWDSHHCFIVRYKEGEELGLDMHHDDSDVTFNVCLGLEFGGAGLQFCGQVGAPDHRRQRYTYRHSKGRCVVHLGHQRHGADDIEWGERLNLVLWNRSSAHRRSRAYEEPAVAPEEGPPDLACLSYTHDRDFGVFKDYGPAQEAFAARAWCPPQGAEYPGFRVRGEAKVAGG